MCVKRTIEDETGKVDVKLWDKACYELFNVTVEKMRELWEEGNEKPRRQDAILEVLNARVSSKMSCLCKAGTWTFGLVKKTEFQISVNTLEVAS